MLCRVCGHSSFALGIDLGMQPWGNHFLKEEEIGLEPVYPLRLVLCEQCHTAQLDHTVKKEVMFGHHTYLSGMTRSLARHFQETAREVDARFFQEKKQKSALDIGSNDGTQLLAYKELGYDVLGVESAQIIAEIAEKQGVPTLNAFFNLETAHRIGRTFDLINASGVFFHLEELHSVTEAIRTYLAPEGLFLVQFLYMKSILENVAFDQIYHEHLLYYTLHTLSELLRRHGLELFDAQWSPVHGGSILGYVGHPGKRPITERLRQLQEAEMRSGCNEIGTYPRFVQKVEQSKERSLRFLHQKKGEGKRVFGLGAPVKGNTLLNFFGIGRGLLECLVEKNELRRGLFSPGMHLPVYIEKEISPPDAYYVLAWNFKEEILKNNRALQERGVEFYFPVDPAS